MTATLNFSLFDVDLTDEGMTLSAEISELPVNGFPEAISLTVENGDTVLYEATQTVFDTDQDVVMVTYKTPTSNTRLIIFND